MLLLRYVTTPTTTSGSRGLKGFYCALCSIARYYYSKSSVRLSVCLSVRLYNVDGLRSNMLELFEISPNIMDVLHWEHPEILAGIGEEYRKVAFGSTIALIYL